MPKVTSLCGPVLKSCRNVDDFEKLNRIEEGGKIVALKKLKLENEKDGFPVTALREIHTLKLAVHPNIVQVTEIATTASLNHIFIVMEYLDHDLKSLQESMSAPFLLSETKTLLLQLLSAVQCLHNNWIVHRDLKTSNILMNNQGTIKVADFGMARRYGSPLGDLTQLVVTLWYRAPELLLGATTYSPAIDMWSVGCIFAELLEKKPLFPGKGEIEQLSMIFQLLGTPSDKTWPGFSLLPNAKTVNFTKQPHNNIRKRFPFLSANGIALLDSLLCYDPNTESYEEPPAGEETTEDAGFAGQEDLQDASDYGENASVDDNLIEEDEESGVAAFKEELADVPAQQELPPFPAESYSFGFGEVPKAWPLYSLVNLDRKIPIKLRKYEYEPLGAGVIGNISMCSEAKVRITSSIASVVAPFGDDLSFLSDNEAYSTEMLAQFIAAVDLSRADGNLDTFGLTELRKLCPDAPLLFLSTLLDFLIRCEDEGLVAKDTVRVAVAEVPPELEPVAKDRYTCRECFQSCSRARYSIVSIFYNICIDCFEMGRYPLQFSSSDFEFQVGILGLGQSSDRRAWSLEERLSLLDSIERFGDDWGLISNSVGRPVHECKMEFAVLSIFDESPPKNPLSVLKQLLGTPPNPVMALVKLLSNAVHPCVGAEAARASLSVLSTGNVANTELLWHAATFALEAVLRKCGQIQQLEENAMEKSVKELIELEFQNLEKKTGFLDSLFKTDALLPGNT
ncbi:hypothetical protein HDV03_002768 [Kappamyces sp. JEL0829]|nr:hypothetical protein HDV03_002768 [Kappamyces sp. JEL0829]